MNIYHRRLVHHAGATQRRATAERKRRSRIRRRLGMVVLKVSLPEYQLIEALQAAGRLDDDGGLDRRRVEEAVEHLVTDWIGRWQHVTRPLPKPDGLV